MKRKKSAWPTLLLDRDGTLIAERDFLRDPAQVCLLPGVASGLKRLRKAGFRCVVISNQSGVARGIISRAQLKAVRQRFAAELKKRGARLDGYYGCPHLPTAGCPCRKPRLGLVKRAARDLGTTWRRGISLGDRASDVVLGQKTGGWGVFILTGYGRRNRRHLGVVKPDYVARDFADFVRFVLKHRRKDGTWTI
jgi:histidinol-phosphate phosphatase family protein